MLSANYFNAVTPNGEMCQEFITLGSSSTAPKLVGVPGNIPMHAGKCDSQVWTKLVNSASAANGVYKFLARGPIATPIITPTVPSTPAVPTGDIMWTGISPSGETCEETVAPAGSNPKMLTFATPMYPGSCDKTHYNTLQNHLDGYFLFQPSAFANHPTAPSYTARLPTPQTQQTPPSNFNLPPP